MWACFDDRILVYCIPTTPSQGSEKMTFKEIIATVRRKPARALDGRTDEEAGHVEVKDTGVLHDLLHLKGKDALALAHGLKDMSSGEPLNDRDLLLEHGVNILQKLPANSGLSHKITDGFISMLWNDLPHPPATYLGDEHRYRSGDGSGNSILNPQLGAAGQPYSRSVPATTPKNPFLPEPELVFDQLLRRREFTPHKSGLNRLFFSFATVVIHECFQTDYRKPWINATSSYVDLSCLYGNVQEEQNRVRTFEQGRIFPDTIASERIMMMPPGVVAVLLLFSRHHNHIAERIFEVNETRKYKPWSELKTEEERKWQDEDIFQLSRNVNVAFFAKAVLTDYVSAILNTVRADSTWSLDLGKEIRHLDGSRVERGTGNSVSCEFNVLYHWHAALSAADDQWMQGVLKQACPDKEIEDISITDFKTMMMKHKIALDKQKPSEWTFNGLKRKEDGYFDNFQLAELIKDAVEEPAHAFGARGTPSCMKIIDVLGQLQARNVFNVCTMNEFRKYLNLTQFKTFEEWNSDPEIAFAAERLYGHVDQLELYPGLLAEEAKPNMPGSGVQPGHSIGRGILNDAVALVRGDRFLTTDLNASTLTNWGLAQLKPVPGGYGGFLGHLLFRALPNSWGHGYSTYALLPFYTPSAVSQILADNKKSKQYVTSRPPSAQRLYGLHSYKACKDAFEDRDTFRVPYLPNLEILTNRAGFFLGYDDHTRHDPPNKIMHEAFFEKGFEQNVRQYYASMTQKHIKKATLSYVRTGHHQLNVVRDVFNVVPIHWIADRYGIPLKTNETPHGLLSPFELHATLVALFIFCSFDVIPEASFLLRGAAEKFGPSIRSLLETRYKLTNGGAREGLADWLSKGSSWELTEAAHHLYHTLHKHKVPMNNAVANMVGTMLPIAGNITQQSALLLDLFLEPKYAYAKERLTELARRDENDVEAEKEMEMWMWEGMRVRGIVPGLPRTAARDVTIPDGPDRVVSIKAGENLIIAISKAHVDPSVFPDPERLDPTRDPKKYMLMGHGLHFCFGARLVAPSIVAMLRQVFKLKNLRRAAGVHGQFIKIHEDLGHDKDACTISMYMDMTCSESPIPTSLVVEYDP